MTEVIKYNKNQMNDILANGGSPASAKYLAAQFNYSYALAIRANKVEKRFLELKTMYKDFHRRANAEGWQPAKIAKFE